MFINYIPLMLINMVAGLFQLALYIYLDIDKADQRRWAPGFAMTGLVAVLTGLHMIWNWPLPGSYNIAFGELSVLLGIVFLGAALAQARSWSLLSVAIYAFFAGLVSVVVGLGIVSRGMTKAPLLSGIGFVVTGLGGMLIAPVLHLRANRALRLAAVIALLIAAAIWALTGYGAYWTHLGDYAKWAPALMRP